MRNNVNNPASKASDLLGSLSRYDGDSYENVHSKSEFVLSQTLSLVFHLVQFFKCWQLWEKKNKVVFFCLRPPLNVKQGIFMSLSCSDGEEMYKKAWCACKVVVLLIKSIAFWPFLLLSLLSLLSFLLSKIKGPLVAGWCIKILLSWFFRKDKEKIKLPRNMEDAQGLGRALSNYTDEYFTQVLVGFVVIYILYPFDLKWLICKTLIILSFDHRVCFFNEYPWEEKRSAIFMQERSKEGEKHGFLCAWAEYYLQPNTVGHIAHEQTIICRQLFAGHVVGSRPMKRKKNLLGMIIIPLQPSPLFLSLITTI